MRGLICYYSGSGNTRLACEYIARTTSHVAFDLFDVVRDGQPTLDGYGLVGFATFADFFGPPMRMKTFLRGLPAQRGMPALVFHTCGSIGGKTLGLLDRWATRRGFRVLASHGLHTPENYPPMIARGMTFAGAPNGKELAAFKRFVGTIDEIADKLSVGATVRRRRPRAGFFRFLPTPPRTLSRRLMGRKLVDHTLCTACGVCESACPYGAIRLDPMPVFDQGKCYGCWACYNHCPTKAIHTRKLRGVGHSPRPSAALVEKLGG